ncbi:NAD(P)-binding domain-containing protein [Rhizomonospora bruguierae]|uniref:NAD(P)-binding domain-containing protein n=1 Tax=Rhizomonospora bruguierae TaxID=1581705 RepID=UPI001BCD28F8|nr:NAD(P)-binding domain-containing protein [Micromonospora sp. NBRC 107566]
MDVDVVVIGAGQAGLSSAYFLRHYGFGSGSGSGFGSFVVLDAERAPGGAWQHRSPSLTMAEVHGIFDLPRAQFAGSTDRPANVAVPAYFAAYEKQYDLPIHRPVRVESVSRGDDRLIVATDHGTWRTRAVINATGTWRRPYWPYYPGRFGGRQLHYAQYRGPGEFAGRRVVVVGGGASAAHVLADLGGVAADTLWVTRRPPVFREGPFGPEEGRAVVAKVDERVRAGLPPQSVVSVTGLTYSATVRRAMETGTLDRRPMFARLTHTGVEWAGGDAWPADAIVWCTGFRAALSHLAPLNLRERGGGIRVDGTRVVAAPRLHLVGYGPSASTVGANRAGRAAARELRDALRPSPAASGAR